MQSQHSTDLSAIVAMTPQGVIGLDGDMPWRLSSDLRRFKKLTMGGRLIMGRKTYDSIGRPLPGRQTIVITRNRDWVVDGVSSASSPDEAVEIAERLSKKSLAEDRQGKKNFVVGGAEVYRQLIGRCDEILLTRVWSQVSGDTVLSLDLSSYRAVESLRVPASAKDSAPTEFVRLRRVIN